MVYFGSKVETLSIVTVSSQFHGSGVVLIRELSNLFLLELNSCNTEDFNFRTKVDHIDNYYQIKTKIGLKSLEPMENII